MENTGIIVGLDIGTTKICAIVGRKNEYGKIDVLGFGKSNSDGVERGVVNNIDKTVASIEKAIKEAVESSNVEINHVYVGIAGQHIKSFQHQGSIVRRNFESEITQEDIDRLIEDTHKLAMAPGERIIHVIPQDFTVDQDHGIVHPIGMSGIKLEGNFHIITGQVTAVQNIFRCVDKSKLNVIGMILEPIASASSVLTEEEKEAGVVLVDIGGGTTDVAIFKDGKIRHTAVYPIGGNIITEDIKEGCKVMRKQAEALKIEFGSAMAKFAEPNQVISIPGMSGREPKEISKKNLAHIIEARVTEIFEHVKYEIDSSGYDKKLIAGIVLTGGGSLLRHITHLVELNTGMDTRIGFPTEHLGKGLTDQVKNPMYSTSLGLVIHAMSEQPANADNKVKKPEPTNGKAKPGHDETPNTGFIKNLLNKGMNWLKDDSFDDF